MDFGQYRRHNEQDRRNQFRKRRGEVKFHKRNKVRFSEIPDVSVKSHLRAATNLPVDSSWFRGSSNPPKSSGLRSSIHSESSRPALHSVLRLQKEIRSVIFIEFLLHEVLLYWQTFYLFQSCPGGPDQTRRWMLATLQQGAIKKVLKTPWRFQQTFHTGYSGISVGKIIERKASDTRLGEDRVYRRRRGSWCGSWRKSESLARWL